MQKKVNKIIIIFKTKNKNIKGCKYGQFYVKIMLLDRTKDIKEKNIIEMFEEILLKYFLEDYHLELNHDRNSFNWHLIYASKYLAKKPQFN